jgi:hypothetical protein
VTESEVRQDLGLSFPHASFLFRFRVIVTEQMQDAMNNQQTHLGFQCVPGGLCLSLGTRDRDEDIADITRAAFRVRFRGRERKYIGGRVDPQVICSCKRASSVKMIERSESIG